MLCNQETRMREFSPEDMPYNRREPVATVTYNGQAFEMQSMNTIIKLFADSPRFDHIIVGMGGKNHFFFRRFFEENSITFRDLVAHLDRHGARPMDDLEYAPAHIQDMYFDRYGYDPIPEFDTLMPRREKQVLFARYLLERGYVTPASFIDADG